MATRKPRVRFNYRDYCLLPEDRRYELIDGELLMAPAPGSRHQRLLFRLARLLADFVDANQSGEVLISPFDVIFSEEDVVQPDLVFIAREREELISERGLEGPPDLVVEVLSPSTARRDRELKRKLYAHFGVREYWLVDPEANTVEVLAPGGEDYLLRGAYREEDEVVSPVLPGLRLPLGQVFQR